jgi:hypothetical protein
LLAVLLDQRADNHLGTALLGRESGDLTLLALPLPGGQMRGNHFRIGNRRPGSRCWGARCVGSAGRACLVHAHQSEISFPALQ